jgi:hypothetical protein
MEPLIHSKPSDWIYEAGSRDSFAHPMGNGRRNNGSSPVATGDELSKFPPLAALWLCRFFYDMSFDDWQTDAGMCDGESMAGTTGSLLGNTKQKLHIQTGDKRL